MPIPGEQFEKGLDKTDFQMIDFLKKHQDNAYTIREIVEGIGVSLEAQEFGKRLLIAVAVVFGYGSSLDRMAEKGLIDKKIVNGENYYRIHKK